MQTDAISRSWLWTNIMMLPHNGDMISSEEVEEEINTAPALDVAPVVHGEFARLPEEVIPCLHVDPVLCKACNTTFFTFNKEGKRLMLCPYCGARYSGARMDGGVDNDP